MDRTQEEREILLIAMKAGRILLENGAEIFRVEETIYRICQHYGLKSASAFVLSNGIFLTSGDEKETQFARVQLIPVNNANLSRVAEVNDLSRRIEAGECSLEEVKAELNRIETMPDFPQKVQFLCYAISASCFSIMFHGDLLDAISSFFIGALFYLYLIKIGKPHLSKIVCNIAGGALISAMSIFCYKLGIGHHLEAMMIGGIILMVPGVAFTNAIRDMADCDYISGSVRMLDAILVFFCIAMGVGFTMTMYQTITGGVLL